MRNEERNGQTDNVELGKNELSDFHIAQYCTTYVYSTVQHRTPLSATFSSIKGKNLFVMLSCFDHIHSHVPYIFTLDTPT